MGGDVTFQDALAARLDIIQPSTQLMQDFHAVDPLTFTPGFPEVVAALRARGTRVFLVSGGFTQMIQPHADTLGIPKEDVFANSILFGPDGAYAGFDKEAFTCRSGGKPVAVQHIVDSLGLTPVVMVGDGVTDMEAAPPAAAFIGYGGVAAREAVVKGAHWFVSDWEEVLDVLR